MTYPDRECLVKALERMCRHFPTDTDMEAAGWSRAEVDAACDAYDHARALIAKARHEPPPFTA
ncbi:hypothetical protein [Acidovorax phage AP1]|nr:hypothetical protein [Acidovorax phage AP1]